MVYRAIADWSELRDETVKAKAALKDLAAVAKAEGDAETKAAADAADAHRKNVTAIDAERRSMESLATAAKSAATWTTFGGRNSMAQHLSDLNQEVNYQNLLNRAQWLGFSSPQAAYSWRQTELQQAYLMNRAKFGATSSGTGFTTPDQYLGYLAKERTALQAQNEAMLERAAVYRSNADAFTAYSNALRGSHGTVGTLSEGNLASAQAYEAALAGLPDQVTTKLTVDDSAFIARLAADRAMLSDLTRTYTARDVITASYRLGGQPLNRPDVAPATIPVSFSGPWQDQAASILATIADLNQDRVVVPVDFRDDAALAKVAAFAQSLKKLGSTEVLQQLVNVHAAPGGGGGPPGEPGAVSFTSLPAASSASAGASERAAAAAGLLELAADTDKLAAADRRMQAASLSAAAGLLDEVAAAERVAATGADAADAWDKLTASEIAAMHAADAAAVQLIKAHLAHPGVLTAGGSAGGGAGKPPAPPAAAAGAGAPDPNVAAAWKDLSAAELAAGDAADASQVKMAALSAAADGNGKAAARLAYVYQVLSGQEKAAADNARGTTGALGQLSGAFIGAAQGWAALGTRIALFGGIFSVSLWHILADAILEFLIALGGAIIGVAAMAAAVGIFIGVANLAQDTLGRISDRLKAVNIAATATGQAIYPMTNSFDNLAHVIRPQVWQLYGDALGLVGGQMGQLGQIAVKTGAYLDTLAAKFVVWFSQPSVQQGFQHLIATGIAFAKQFGQIFQNLGGALLGFLHAAELTHISEDIGIVLIALTKLLEMVSHLPAPLLAAAFGLHALYLWGGLAATALLYLLDPLRAVALAVGGLDVAESALSQLPRDASALEKLKATVNDIGAGFGALPGRIGGAARATETAAADGSRLGGIFGFLAANSVLATTGVGLLAAAAGFFAYKALTARDNTQQWIDAMNKGLSSQSLFTVIGKTTADLAAVTQQLASSQNLGAQAARELGGAQTDLSIKLQNELVHTGDISRAYGVSMPQALGLLNTAGVKASALFTDQNKVWAAAQQQVKGLVAGYAAMGQGLTQLQGDVSVQLVMNADQLKQMAQLNTAWDSWLGLVTGGESAFTKFQQDMGTTTTAAQVAGASMTGLNTASIALRTGFIGMVPDAGKVLDAIRSQSAVLQDGAAGSRLLTRATKDLAAEMIPLAGNNLAARAAIVATVEEANPAVNTWQKLTKWVGHEGAAGAAQDLQGILFKLAVPVSDLAADAAKLTTTLQSDLNPAMAQAEFNALGGQKAFSTFATDLTRFGPGSQATLQAGAKVATMLLAIDKNTGTARNQFLAWAESMGLPQKAAEALWAQVYKLTGQPHTLTVKSEISKTEEDVRRLQKELSDTTDPAKRAKIRFEINYDEQKLRRLHDDLKISGDATAGLRNGLATSATASDKLAKSGFFAQVGDRYRTNTLELVSFFGHRLPETFVAVANAWDGLWGKSYTGFMRDIGSPLASFLTRTLPGFFTGTIPRAWDKAWSELGAPVVRAVDAVKKVFTSSFDGWWKSHGFEVKQVWQAVVDNMAMWWDNFTGGLKRAWETFTGWFRGGGGDISKILKSGFDAVLTSIKPFISTAEGLFRLLWLTIEAGGKAVWAVIAATGKTAWDAMAALFKTVWAGVVAALKIAWDLGVGVLKAVWDAFVGVINVTLDLITGHWSKAWHDMLAAWNQVNGAIDTAFRQTWNAIWGFLRQGWGNFSTFFHQLWNNSINMLEQLWHAFWGWFSATIIAAFGNFFTRTIPHWFDGFVAGAKNSWNSAWSAFDRTVIAGMSHFFTSTVPRWWGDFVRGGEGAMRGIASSIQAGFKDSINWVVDHVINSVINFVDNDILKHLPGSLHINTIGHVASGGDVSAAAGGGRLGAPMRFAAGSVPGTGDEDGTHIVAMGGEYMLRKPARMALEAAYGRGFMNHLNQADTWLGAGSRGSPASQQRRPGVNAYATGGLVNPIGPGLRPERVDMGVDYGGSGELYAIGSGVITNLWNSGWPGGTFLAERLNPTYGSGYWYYAEDVLPLVGTGGIHVGAPVRAGQHIATALGGPSGIEVGWAAPPGTGQTAAAAAGQSAAGQRQGDPGKYPTAWGVAASNLIKSLGGPSGIISGPVQGGTGGLGGAFSAVWQTVEGLLDAAGNGLGDLVKPLGRWVSGGAGELLKLARQGAASIFGSIWDHTIKPMAELVPGDTFAGTLAQGSAAEIRQGIVNFLKGQDSTAQSTAASSGGGGGSIGPVSGPADAGPGQAENYANSRLSAYGWGSSQMGPLSQLWMRESGWDRFARNPSSGAYGIPQALPPTKLPGAGQAGGGSHASPQIDWGLGYIKSTPGYGSPAAAWAHEVAHGWYPFGGVIGQYAAGGPVAMAAGGPFSTVPAFRSQLALKQQGEAAKYFGLEHAFAAGPAKYRTKLTVQELGTLSRRQADELAAYNKLAGSGLTASGLSHLGATARAEELTANDQQLSRPAAQGGHPLFASDLRGFLHDLSVLSGEKIPAGSTTGPGADLAPSWGSALSSVAGSVGSLDTAVASVESPAFWALAGENLSAVKGVTPAQAGAWHAWRTALTKQQYKTFGLGHSPPGAFGVLQANFGNPAKITAGQWGAFKSDVDYMVREEAGTGISGGINPPGTPADSGYVPWHYFHPQWAALRGGLLKVQQRVPLAEQTWRNLYGPGHLPATPGPGAPPAATSLTGLPDVSAVATMGGPAVPVSAPGLSTPDYGFAAGGGLGQVADLFGGLSSGSVLPVVARYGIPDSVLSQLTGSSRASGETPRRLSQAAAATVGGDQVGVKVENMTVYNPAPVDVGSSIARASNRLAFLAGRGLA